MSRSKMCSSTVVNHDKLRNGIVEEPDIDFSWIIDLMDEKDPENGLQNDTENSVNNSDDKKRVSLLDEPIPLSESALLEPCVMDVWAAYQEQLRIRERETTNGVNSIIPAGDKIFDFERRKRNVWSEWSPFEVNCQSEPEFSLWPRPLSLSTYSTSSCQHLGNAFFFIEGSEENWTPEVNVQTCINDPNNKPVSFHITKENRSNSRRYMLSFQPRIPGFYTISTRSGFLTPFHVKGSPFVIPISRNYRLLSSKRSVSFIGRAVKAWGVTFNPTNRNIYVTDRDAHQIIVYHEDGRLLKCFGVQGDQPGQLFRPTGIALDNEHQRLLMTDKDNHRVCMYTVDGDFISCFGKKGHRNGEFTYPWGIAVSSKGDFIAVADSRNHRIQLFDSDGGFLRKYSVFETNPFEFKSQFNYPRGLIFDNTDENIFVTDFNVQAIFKINIELTSRTTVTPVGINLSRPQGMAMDPVGNILICDSRNNCIRVISSAGEHITTIPGHISDSFFHPQDVALLPNGDIIVVDSSSRVRIL